MAAYYSDGRGRYGTRESFVFPQGAEDISHTFMASEYLKQVTISG